MQIKELALTGKQFLKTNTSHVSALEGKISWNELLRLGIECSLSCSFYVYIYLSALLSDQRSWAISNFALIVNGRYSVWLLTAQKPANKPGW